MITAASPSQTIIVRLPNWVGDVCMAMPTLQAVAVSTQNLVICARPWAKELVQQFKPQQFVALTGKFYRDLQAIRTIPKTTRRHSVGLVLPDSLSSAALFALAGIKSAGYRDDGRSLLLGWPIVKPAQAVHAVHKYWLLAQQAFEGWSIDSPLGGSSAAPQKVELSLADSDHQAALANMAAHGLTPKNFLLLAPTATGTHHGKAKVWPYFASLASALKSAGLIPVMCPPLHEREQAKHNCPDALLLDPLSLKAFCALTREATLVVCNDSGVSHLAAIAGAHQITLFGVTNPANTRPWSACAQLLGSDGHWPELAEVMTKITAMSGTTNLPES